MAETPALIIEHSFHTNRRAAKWLLEECNLDKLAKAEAQVIAAFFGCDKKIEKKPPEQPVRYRAQVGAYTLENNAKNMVTKLQRAGFEGCILKEDAYHKVLSGGFYEKADAATHVTLLKSKGFSAFVKAVN